MRPSMKALFLPSILIALSMSGCSSNEPKISAELNQSASLAGEFAAGLPTNPLQWKVITSEISRTDSTMATLYGNDLAVQYARTHAEHNYPAGAVLSLVTWTQREDPRWFGARIPATVKSLEFLTVGTTLDGQPSYSYQEYGGAPLKKISAEEGLNPNNRAQYLLSQRAAIMP
jgi:cytochrome P460